MAPKKEGFLCEGSEVVRNGFVEGPEEIQNAIKLLDVVGLEFVLSEPTVILKREVLEFYSSAKGGSKGTSVKSVINGVKVKVNPKRLARALQLPAFAKGEEDEKITQEDLNKALEWCGHSSKTHGSLERKSFNQQGKLVADIVGKALLCKVGSHDRISKPMFEIMARIILSKKTNWGQLIFKRIQESFQAPNLGRILSLYLLLSYPESLNKKYGVKIHHMKRMDIKILDRWEKVLTKSPKRLKTAEDVKSKGESSSEESESGIRSDSSDSEVPVEKRNISLQTSALSLESGKIVTAGTEQEDAETEGEKNGDLPAQVEEVINKIIGVEDAVHHGSVDQEDPSRVPQEEKLEDSSDKTSRDLPSPEKVEGPNQSPIRKPLSPILEGNEGEEPEETNSPPENRPVEFSLLSQIKMLLEEQRLKIESYVTSAVNELKRELSVETESLRNDVRNLQEYTAKETTLTHKGLSNLGVNQTLIVSNIEKAYIASTKRMAEHKTDLQDSLNHHNKDLDSHLLETKNHLEAGIHMLKNKILVSEENLQSGISEAVIKGERSMIKASGDHAIWTTNTIREAMNLPPLHFDQSAEEYPAKEQHADIPDTATDKGKEKEVLEDEEIKMRKRKYREEMEKKDDYERWSPKSRTIILKAWEQVKANKGERYNVYSPQEWDKYEDQEESRRSHRRDKQAGRIPTDAPEPLKYHPKPFEYFIRQAEKEQEASTKKAKGEAAMRAPEI